VLFDPDHDFLREIPEQHWTPSESGAILQFGSHPTDRNWALDGDLAGTPSAESVKLAVGVLSRDKGRFPVFPSIARLGNLKRTDLRPFFHSQLRHASFDRRKQAVEALALMPATIEDTRLLRQLINDNEPYTVIIAAIKALDGWDSNGNRDIVLRAADMYSLRESVRAAAYSIMAKAKSPELPGLLVKACSPRNREILRIAAVSAMSEVDPAEPRTQAALHAAVHDESLRVVLAAARALVKRKDSSSLPELRNLASERSLESPNWFVKGIADQIRALEKEAPR
jgi:aminopeptidase N